MQNTQMPHFTRTHIKTLADEKIGFGYVPDQIRKISQAEGFHINILITGRRGLGTYSLINSLFKLPLIDKNRDDDLNTYKNEIIENDISLRTSITTYHGNDIDLLMRHIETMNEEYFDVEQGLSKPTVDPRIHLCIYMVPDDKLRNDEIRMIKQLSMKCNFLPVIAKADTYTAEELLEYKAKVINMMASEEIKLFMPRIADDDEDEYVDEMRETIDKYPLAVIASTTTHERNNETFYGRLYPWGFIDIENEEVSDFLKLRKLIINNCLDELIFTTDSTFYNDYRKIHMETERVDVALRRNRLAKIRYEMENILKSKNEKKLKKIMDDIENLEMKYRGKVNIGERDQKIGSALNSAQ